jgi:ferredoxin-type protein NapH
VEGTDGLWWFLGGSALYYALGAALAVALRDNRAFCKYACPVSVLLRSSARYSLLKVSGDADACTRCHRCDAACPQANLGLSVAVDRGARASR